MWASISSMYGVSSMLFNVGQCKVNVWCFPDVVLMWASIRSMYGFIGCCFIVGQYKVNVWCFLDVVLS